MVTPFETPFPPGALAARGVCALFDGAADGIAAVVLPGDRRNGIDGGMDSTVVASGATGSMVGAGGVKLASGCAGAIGGVASSSGTSALSFGERDALIPARR